VRAALTELERVGQDAEPARASAALGVAGLLQFFLLGDDAGGLGSLRRAVALDPDNEGAWEALTFALAFAREYDELLQVSRQRVAHHDSPRNRLLLAKALEKNQQLDAMRLEAELLQARYSEDPLANLTLAAALLKVDRSETGRARALQHLGRASRRTGEKPPPELAVELLYQRGLWFALEGQIERARTQFRGVLELAPGHPDAATALHLLEQLGEAAD
jgi:tetratricopeptide (TPR) repeat protein